jgi:predicted O-methyltransferase YrrM
MGEPQVFQEWDGYLTSHPLLQRSFVGEKDKFAQAAFDFLAAQLGLGSQIEELNLESPEEWRISEMASGRLKMALVSFLLELAGAKRVLEIGTFIGLSSILMAKALGPGSRIVTIEVAPRYAEMARRNILRNSLQSQIEVLDGNALQLISSMATETVFDAFFIDGDKGCYQEYVQQALRLVRPGGLILVDDAFFHGDVFNTSPTTEKGAGVRRCVEFACSSEDLKVTFVPITNGLLVARRL